MSEEKQAGTSIENSDAGSNDDVVVEQRAAKKQGSYIGALLLIAVLIGAGVAAGYYQNMWLPRAQQLWVSLIPPQEQVDLMAAPDLRSSETEQTSNESESTAYALLPAIKEEKPAEETSNDVAAVPVAPLSDSAAIVQVEEAPVLHESPVDEIVKDVANDIVMDDEASLMNNSAAENSEAMPVAPAAVIPLAPKVQDTTITASIVQARQAFWARDLVKAESIYREYLRREPTAADAWGELGNIYYGQAKWQQAAEAYAGASIQLLEQGQYSQAMFLHYMVRGLDPVQAARIDAKLLAMQAAPQS